MSSEKDIYIQQNGKLQRKVVETGSESLLRNKNINGIKLMSHT